MQFPGQVLEMMERSLCREQCREQVEQGPAGQGVGEEALAEARSGMMVVEGRLASLHVSVCPQLQFIYHKAFPSFQGVHILEFR